MIRVVYDRKALRLTADGHADSGSKEQDLVFAAASILIYTFYYNTIIMSKGNEIKHLPALKLAYGKTEIRAVAKRRNKAKALAVFDPICEGFTLLAKDYPALVDFKVVE